MLFSCSGSVVSVSPVRHTRFSDEVIIKARVSDYPLKLSIGRVISFICPVDIFRHHDHIPLIGETCCFLFSFDVTRFHNVCCNILTIGSDCSFDVVDESLISFIKDQIKNNFDMI